MPGSHKPGSSTGPVKTLSLSAEDRPSWNQKLYRDAFETNPHGILFVAQDAGATQILHCNQAFCRMIGYSEDELLGKPLVSILGPMFDLGTGDILSVDEGDGIVDVDLRIRRKNGVYMWGNVHGTQIVDDQGNNLYWILVVTDITTTKQYAEELRYRTYYDELTGLANRYLLRERLDQALLRARLHGERLAVAFVNLDHFKYVNETLGHRVGNMVLQTTARRLLSAVRSHDTVSHISGDVFVILLMEGVDDDLLAGLLQRILRTVAEPIDANGTELVLTCSIGVSLWPRDGTDADTLLRHADIALYRAKEHGRNNFRFFTQDLNQRLHERVRIERSLRQALKRNQLSLRYQPQYSLANQRLVGAEVLLRWEHPQLGDIEPARFIPLAEETGLIIPISEWVLWSTVRQSCAWRSEGIEPIQLAVNLSAHHFQEANLTDMVRAVLEQEVLDPALLKLEITESQVMNDPEQAIRVLGELKELGVGLAIDDFGTGYSSMNYLRRFPLDQLKIDQSFIRDIHLHADDTAIAKAIISLGHSLNLNVIAEGVSNQAQVNVLQELCCDEVQGYYYGRPQTAAHFKQLLLKEQGDRLSGPVPH